MIIIKLQSMNYSNHLEFTGLNKRLYPNPSATHLNSRNQCCRQSQQTQERDIHSTKRSGNLKRVQESTQRLSSRNPSQSDVFFRNVGSRPATEYIGKDQGSMVNAESSGTNREQPKSNRINILSLNEHHIIELRQRLRNIHHFYKIRIQQERLKNLEKNQIFIGVIEDLQHNHNSKLAQLSQSLHKLSEQKQDVDYVDERMQSVKTTIEQILQQSQELKDSNQWMEKDIMAKQLVCKQKEEQLMIIKKDVEKMRDGVENFQRQKIKQKRRNKELLEIIQNINDA